MSTGGTAAETVSVRHCDTQSIPTRLLRGHTLYNCVSQALGVPVNHAYAHTCMRDDDLRAALRLGTDMTLTNRFTPVLPHNELTSVMAHACTLHLAEHYDIALFTGANGIGRVSEIMQFSGVLPVYVFNVGGTPYAGAGAKTSHIQQR